MGVRLGPEGYRQLFQRLGRERARALVDNLQVLALTRPDTVQELEAFLQRHLDATVAPAAEEDTVLKN